MEVYDAELKLHYGTYCTEVGEEIDGCSSVQWEWKKGFEIQWWRQGGDWRSYQGWKNRALACTSYIRKKKRTNEIMQNQFSRILIWAADIKTKSIRNLYQSHCFRKPSSKQLFLPLAFQLLCWFPDCSKCEAHPQCKPLSAVKSAKFFVRIIILLRFYWLKILLVQTKNLCQLTSFSPATLMIQLFWKCH